MASGTAITITGNVTKDVELRYTQSGLAVANLSVAVNDRVFDKASNEWKEGDPSFYEVAVWKDLAENVAASVTKGTRVVVVGNLRQRSYEDKEGMTRTAWEVTADEVSLSLRFARGSVTRNQSSRTQQDNREQASRPAQPNPTYTNEEVF
jgi:single-strand DNA-binding protein